MDGLNMYVSCETQSSSSPQNQECLNHIPPVEGANAEAAPIKEAEIAVESFMVIKKLYGHSRGIQLVRTGNIQRLQRLKR